MPIQRNRNSLNSMYSALNEIGSANKRKDKDEKPSYEIEGLFKPLMKNGKFKVAIVLPKGTNYDMPNIKALNDEDKTLRACNKWLLAHKDASEASDGAYIGLTGENIDIADSL